MRTLIIDDERLARKSLIQMLENHPEVEVIGECANADEAQEAIEQQRPDLVFLDIQMPGRTGFDLLEDLHFMPRVVFVTAYDEYALKAFEINALDYLLKPVEEHRLAEALQKVARELSVLKQHEQTAVTTPATESPLRADDQIFLKDGEKCWFVMLKDVRMFESEGNYVRVYFSKYKPLILKSLNNLEKRLDEREFFRISRKFILNLKEIEHIEPWFNGGLKVRLRTGEELEVSRRQSARFRELLSL